MEFLSSPSVLVNYDFNGAVFTRSDLSLLSVVFVLLVHRVHAYAFVYAFVLDASEFNVSLTYGLTL